MEKTILLLKHVTGIQRRSLLWDQAGAANKRFVLRDINLQLKAGYIYGLIGENGAGKTTLMHYILKDTIPYKGHIYIEATDIRKDHAQILNRIGYVSGDRRFFENCTAGQNAGLLGAFYENFHEEIFTDAMAAMNLSARKVYKTMSRGERLKFQLAFAMAHEPCLYLLDEVTAGMDPVFRVDFFRLLQQIIRDGRACVLMTSHITEEIETRTDYVGVMVNGSLVRFGESLDIIPDLRKGRACGEGHR